VGMLRVMSRRGDDQFPWPDLGCESDLQELKEEQRKAVKRAEEIFEEERKKSATAFLTKAGKPAQRIEEFDPFIKKDEEIIIVPRVVGG